MIIFSEIKLCITEYQINTEDSLLRVMQTVRITLILLNIENQAPNCSFNNQNEKMQKETEGLKIRNKVDHEIKICNNNFRRQPFDYFEGLERTIL